MGGREANESNDDRSVMQKAGLWTRNSSDYLQDATRKGEGICLLKSWQNKLYLKAKESTSDLLGFVSLKEQYWCVSD